MRDVREVLRLHLEGYVPMREVARMQGIARSTVRDMVVRFERSKLAWPVPAEISDAELEGKLYGSAGVNPLHYLALIEQKPGALDQAAALQGWDLPEIFQHLRHLLEARMGNKGKREFIQVLRLLEALPLAVVTDAVTQAVQLGAIGFDAVKLIALARIERRPPRLDLAAYPHLPRTDVKTTRAADYGVLAA